jgi:hypothetical protein
MTDTSLTKRPASFMRAQTQQVRDHVSGMARLTDNYFAKLKRAEAEYFDGVRRITEALAEQSTPEQSADGDGADKPVTAEPAQASL